MLPTEFYFGNSTTILLWLFQSIPHDVLLMMLVFAAALLGVIVLCVLVIVLYVGCLSAYRLGSLCIQLVFVFYDRVRTNREAPPAEVGAESLVVIRNPYRQPRSLDSLMLAHPTAEEQLRTPPAIARTGELPALPEGASPDVISPPPAIQALPPPSPRMTRRRSRVHSSE